MTMRSTKEKEDKNFFLEGSKKTRIEHKCSHCGLRGHHKSNCKKLLVENEEIDQSIEPYNNYTTFVTVKAKIPTWRADASKLT